MRNTRKLREEAKRRLCEHMEAWGKLSDAELYQAAHQAGIDWPPVVECGPCTPWDHRTLQMPAEGAGVVEKREALMRILVISHVDAFYG